MQTFLVNLIVAVLANEKTQTAIKNILGSIITERIVPLIPVAAAAAVDAAIKQIPGVQNLQDVVTVADNVRDVLNDMIPDIDIPLIGNLTDFWRPKG